MTRRMQRIERKSLFKPIREDNLQTSILDKRLYSKFQKLCNTITSEADCVKSCHIAKQKLCVRVDFDFLTALPESKNLLHPKTTICGKLFPESRKMSVAKQQLSYQCDQCGSPNIVALPVLYEQGTRTYSSPSFWGSSQSYSAQGAAPHPPQGVWRPILGLEFWCLLLLFLGRHAASWRSREAQ